MDGIRDGNEFSYVIPSVTLSGPTSAMLARIDDTVRALLALRHLIVTKAGEGSPQPKAADR